MGVKLHGPKHGTMQNEAAHSILECDGENEIA
jgi:hypothetical protein